MHHSIQIDSLEASSTIIVTFRAIFAEIRISGAQNDFETTSSLSVTKHRGFITIFKVITSRLHARTNINSEDRMTSTDSFYIRLIER
jgi:hypothetical protein